jgi:hypothetical protein
MHQKNCCATCEVQAVRCQILSIAKVIIRLTYGLELRLVRQMYVRRCEANAYPSTFGEQTEDRKPTRYHCAKTPNLD